LWEIKKNDLKLLKVFDKNHFNKNCQSINVNAGFSNENDKFFIDIQKNKKENQIIIFSLSDFKLKKIINSRNNNFSWHNIDRYLNCTDYNIFGTKEIFYNNLEKKNILNNLHKCNGFWNYFKKNKNKITNIDKTILEIDNIYINIPELEFALLLSILLFGFSFLNPKRGKKEVFYLNDARITSLIAIILIFVMPMIITHYLFDSVLGANNTSVGLEFTLLFAMSLIFLNYLSHIKLNTTTMTVFIIINSFFMLLVSCMINLGGV
jgi:hypothetical protein